MMKKLFLAITFGWFATAVASTDALPPKEVQWPFDGMRGKVDRQAAQRGFQVYKEVCSTCHGLKLVSYRNLHALGFSEAEVKAIAAGYMVQDGPNDQGDMYERPGKPSDNFVAPYKNEQAARAANNGLYPVDLSLITKARPNGPNYVYSLLIGYEQTPPNGFHVPDGLYYNPYFPGGKIGMPAPLSDNQVQYSDGTTATVDQMARDVVTFLQWAAEPEMEDRKSMGIQALLYLAIFTVFFYLAKQRVWARIKR